MPIPRYERHGPAWSSTPHPDTVSPRTPRKSLTGKFWSPSRELMGRPFARTGRANECRTGIRHQTVSVVHPSLRLAAERDNPEAVESCSLQLLVGDRRARRHGFGRRRVVEWNRCARRHRFRWRRVVERIRRLPRHRLRWRRVVVGDRRVWRHGLRRRRVSRRLLRRRVWRLPRRLLWWNRCRHPRLHGRRPRSRRGRRCGSRCRCHLRGLRSSEHQLLPAALLPTASLVAAPPPGFSLGGKQYGTAFEG